MDANAYVQQEIEKAQEAERIRQEEELKIEYAESIAEGDTFMEENGKREEVVTLPSGLQYEILKQGTGAVPTETDRVKVHYHGTVSYTHLDVYKRQA